jgi:hypothetical protein
MWKENEDKKPIVRHVDLTMSSGSDDDENHDDRRHVDLTMSADVIECEVKKLQAEEELVRSTSPVTTQIDFAALHREREARQAAKLLAGSLQGEAAGEPHFSSSFMSTASFQTKM